MEQNRPSGERLKCSVEAMPVTNRSIQPMEQVSKLKDNKDVKELYLEDEEFRHWFDAYRSHYDKIQSNHTFKYFEEDLISDPDKLFGNWKIFYGKSYDNEDIFKEKKTIFRNNARIFYNFNKSLHDVFFYGKRFLYFYSDCPIADTGSLKRMLFISGDFPYDPIRNPHLRPSEFADMCKNDDSLIPPYPPKKREGKVFVQMEKDKYIKNAEYREFSDRLDEELMKSDNEGLKYDEEELVSDDHVEDLFKRWMKYHSKTYRTKEEWDLRFRLFKLNAKRIYEFNKSSHDAFFFKMYLSTFSAYTNDEVGGMDDDDDFETLVDDEPQQAPRVTTTGYDATGATAPGSL